MNLAAFSPADNTANIIYSAVVRIQTVLCRVVHENTAAVARNSPGIHGVAASDIQVGCCFRAVEGSIRIFPHNSAGVKICCVASACYIDGTGMHFCQIDASV
ncbi:hypothetical protein D3C78_1712630 [compost metagenome]